MKFEWENWVKDKYLGKFFIRYALVGFLVVGLVWKQEKKKILYSLRKEKKFLLKQAIFALGIFAFFHFILKGFWWLTNSAQDFLPHRSEKINTLIKVITASKEGKIRGLLGLFFGLCILAPLLEECIFRHFVFTLFGKKSYFSYFFSFFAFILAHYHWGENVPVLFLQYSVATVGFIYVYKKSNWNLLAPMSFHSLVNLVFIIVTIINPECFLI
ncbi:MAG: CPBP family intramembrane metalloprotease [Candidatus Moeniiplasma glomeromycotorum]|nr:CPBP family intramembrane metalloprotease [Candidatus Moeniiplasma glomeromycotorum]MCE8167361.1 CPBP family intramembrane metalloprotease [Candidatus Moeniiplasma glomeromycotorum]MCE8168626.1 CPBP family intramembrane metalloprotease [Candidatus Moeniiplasma glomeromycotorum]